MYIFSKIPSLKFSPFPHNPGFKSHEKILQKMLWPYKKILVTNIFSFSSRGFFPIKDKNHYLLRRHLYVLCKCLQLWSCPNFFVLYRVTGNRNKVHGLYLCSDCKQEGQDGPG